MRLRPFVLMVVICILAAFFGSACTKENRNAEDPPAEETDSLSAEQLIIPGRWGIDHSALRKDQETKGILSKLRSLSYLSGYNKPTAGSGVLINDMAKISPGLTLFCSGHAAVALLMDLDGNVIHEWKVAFADVWPKPLKFNVVEEHKEFLRRAHVYPNGDLLAIFEYIGIVKLDKNSNIIWSNARRHHHDLKVLDDGTIVTLRKVKRLPEKIRMVLGRNAVFKSASEDVISFISPDGTEIDQIGLLKALHDSEYASILDRTHETKDLFHANSVSIIDQPFAAQNSLFGNGDIVVSLRDISTIVVIDAESRTVKWALSGMWLRQHQAEYLENGNILLLDNMGGSEEFYDFNRSQVIEVDPLTQEIVWRFNGDPDKSIFTRLLGYVQRLPNGNTLITESSNGRLLEVTSDGEVVWEYVSPYRAGENGELIATLMGAQRLSLNSLPFLADLAD